MNLFVFGLGYSAQASIAALRRKTGASLEVAGTTRTPASRSRLAGEGVAAHLFDGRSPGPDVAAALADATHLLVSIPPSEAGDPALLHHRAEIDAASRLRWICYYSTVGVYGDFGGAWIDESAPCHPDNPRSRLRLEVEAAWRDHAEARGIPLLILRIAGIYGPGRSGFDRLRAGTARRIVKPGQVFNRIHVADIGRITALAAQAGLAGTFNLADTEPTPPQDVVAYAARLLGVEPPPDTPFERAEMTSMARSFYSDNKRVSGAAITRALGIELLYPSYREGLAAILAEEGQT